MCSRQLPITLEDGESFGKGESLFTFDCCRRQKDDDAVKNPTEELKLNVVNGDAETEAEV